MWRLKYFYQSIVRLAGPGLFWVFGAFQAFVIGKYLAGPEWHDYLKWPLAVVIGYTPFLGALVAAKATAGFWLHQSYARLFFLTPFWLFGLLAVVQIGFLHPPIRALRLLRAPITGANVVPQTLRWPRGP